MIKVAVIDDHNVVRLGIQFALKADKGISFVGGAADGADVVSFYEEKKPDVLLLDVRMPGTDGITALKKLLAAHPEAKVMMLTTSDAEQDVADSLRAGARGYVMKESDPKEIRDAVHAIAAGDKAFSEGIESIMVAHAQKLELSPRETESLGLIAKGLSNVEIADILHISPDTVKMHVKHVLQKLEAADRAEAVSIGYARGILKL